MKILLLLALITLSETTIGVFVKLTDGLIPIQTLTFYAMACAAAFLFVARTLASGERPRFPKGNVKDTVIIGVLIAAQGGVFNFAMSLMPIANAVIFWGRAVFRIHLLDAVSRREGPKKRRAARKTGPCTPATAHRWMRHVESSDCYQARRRDSGCARKTGVLARCKPGVRMGAVRAATIGRCPAYNPARRPNRGSARTGDSRFSTKGVVS